MKKFLLFLLMIMFCFLLVSCGHTHSMTEKKLLDATCSTPGEIEHSCTKCDYNYVEKIDTAEHSYGKRNVIVEATCTVEGKSEYTCLICGKKKEETIAAKHNFKEETVTEASCRKAGTKKLICSVCGHQETQETHATGHLFVDKECTKCGAYKASELGADTWYTYKELNILKVQNAIVSTATPMGEGVMVGYYPVCDSCHITGLFSAAGPEINHPVTKTYSCNDCGEETFVKFKIDY